MGEHSNIMGSSSAERRINCTGSAALEANIESTTSPHAERGTALHDLVELALLEGALPTKFRGRRDQHRMENGDFVDIAPNDWLLANRFFLQFNAFLDGHNVEIFETEAKYAHTKNCGPDVFGRCDFYGLAKRYRQKHALIVDFKFGVGELVHPIESMQCGFHWQGAIDNETEIAEEGKDGAFFVIVQPDTAGRVHIKQWRATRQWQKAYARLERDAYRAIKTQNTTLNPGAHCRWCSAKAVCPARRKSLDWVAGAKIDNESISNVELAEVLRQGEEAAKTYVAALELAHRRAVDEGQVIPGFKVVKGRGARNYVGDEVEREQAARSQFGDAAFDTQLKSPAQLEKLAVNLNREKDYKRLAKKFVEKTDGKLKVVSNSSPGVAVNVNKEAFELPEGV